MALHSPEFRHITDDALREWKNSGSGGFKLPGPVPTQRFLYELCWALVRGDLPLQKYKAALDSAEFSDGKSSEEVGSFLADIIAHMVQDSTMPGDYHTRLTKLAKLLVDSAVVPHRLLQERCEEEFLWESEMTKMKAQDLKAKEVRVNTRLLYQQTKFNLLREESEGYAKLVTLLCQSGLESTSESKPAAIISKIKSLIGHFDLDPNRVFDIVLECFELHPNCINFYSLIPIFPKSHASQVLGFKFQYYQRIEVKVPVPFELYQLAALLVKAESIDLDSIYAHLLPKDDEAFEVYNSFLAKRLEEVNKIGKINLAATGKDLLDEDKQDAVTDFLLALEMENEAVAGRAPELESNQCLGLLLGFLSVEDWYHAHILFDRLSHLNPTEHIQICDALLRLIEKSISHSYAVVFPNASQCRISKDLNIESAEGLVLPQSQSPIDLPRELFQMLSFAGPYLYRDTILMQKVCRVLKGYYLSAQELIRAPDGTVTANDQFRFKEAKARVEEAVGTCLLPSLQLIPANPAISQEIWEVLCLFSYEVRYRLYGEWEKEEELLPVVLSARQIAKLETRRMLKRLSNENIKHKSRMVAKLAHANPMIVLSTIVHQIEAYKDMIAPVVEAFKYLTQLEYDILEYVVIERLAQGGREKLKDDGLNLSDWLQSLASFWGYLCKRYPSMELRGLIQYLVNQLKKGIGIELILLQELIQQMANFQYIENMTEEQLESTAGSETLRSQACASGITRSNKTLLKSANRLRDSLLPKEEPKLALPLLLLIAQHRSTVVTDADAPYIKVVSEQFDRCHGTLLQYVDFLCSSLTPIVAYAQLIPTLHDLIYKYHLDAEVAFLIYRPVMRLFRSAGKSGICWPLDSSGESLIPNSEKEIDRSEFILDFSPHQKAITWSDLLDTVHSMLPSKTWNSLSPELYATFWGLTLYDLYAPRSCYESEIAKQHAAIKALEELSDNSSSAIAKRKKDKERIQEVLERLISDLQNHEEHVVSVRRRLSSEKDKWLTSCSDTLKTNMEFFQRCIFPRCIFSMTDAVYCAKFVHTLHSLETPFFNTVNHLDIFICKTLQPMICCCTEYEAGRLGRFLYETLKLAYHWKSDESIYDRECGNKPGFAVYYRFPNSPRVTFAQFVRVHIKWGARLTKLFIQCLESSEYMEMRNALITLTKISSVFPVTRRSGVNIEKRVIKIKMDDREDLKVLATSVAASLAARKSSWVSDEEFAMGFVDPKPAGSAAKCLSGNMIIMQNGSSMNNQNEGAGIRVDRPENASISKSDLPSQKIKTSLASNHPETATLAVVASGLSKPSTSQKNVDDNVKGLLEESTQTKTKRSSQILSKQPKQEIVRDDSKVLKSLSRGVNQISTPNGDKETWSYLAEGKQCGTLASSMPVNGHSMSNFGKVSATSTRDIADIHGNNNTPNMEAGSNKPPDSRLSGEKDTDSSEVPDGLKFTSSRAISSPVYDESILSSRMTDKQQKRTSSAEEQERIIKRRKGDEPRDVHSLEIERTGEQTRNKMLDKSKDRISERHDKDHREKVDRSDKTRGEEIFDKTRDKSVEKIGRERSIERAQDKGPDRGSDRLIDKSRDDRNKEERNKSRYSDAPLHSDERFHGQNLPPPPPLPSYFVPQSVSSGRRDEDADRRAGTTRHMQRLSPRNDEKERRHSEENLIVSLDEAKHRREDETRERKHEERDGASVKVEDREREKANLVKDDIDPNAATKRRKIKREMPPSEAGRDYSPVGPPTHSALPLGMSQPTDGRDRGERKATLAQHRSPYNEETSSRTHTKEAATKIPRRDNDQVHERDWEEEKRLRAEAKRKHRK